MSKVHYFPPNTTADFSFWEKLYDIKLNKYGLSGNTTDEKISSYYSQNEIKLTNSSFNTQNFDQTTSSSSDRFYSHGFLRNVNTINEFITLDKTQYLSQFGKKIWNEMITNEVVEDPSLFNQFVLLTFADLKNYKFTHWFGYPTIVPENPFLSYSDPIPLAAPLENQNIFLENSSPLFGLLQSHEGYIPLSFKESLEHHHTSNNLIFVINYTPKSQNQVSSSSPSDQIQCPWHIRNILAYFALKGVGYEVTNPNGKVVKLIFNSSSSNNVDISPIYSIFLPSMSFSQEESVLPKVIGWQPNDRGKPGPNILDASSVMNTQHIMEQAVDLNVRLMKWRLWPNLNTELLSNTKCLLLGAGTLGCAVARTLMGWGVRDITFLDNGRVSYSNPARQSLFEYEDCVTKSFKAKAAAERLLKIFPGMRSHGEVLSIPMPGHAIPPADQDSFVSNVHRLDQLIKDHDVIFALTDSREARWLPTVMCSAHDKLLINAALGFDTYLVMRHGHSVVHSNSTNRLGCYFCMDVTAPGNSQRDRTLDQQCTVTRPGLAQIASGLAVELMVSLLHSPLRQQTQAAPKDGKHNEDEDKEDEENEENDSYLPHQIRGFLSTFLQVQPRCSSFPHCTACSEVVVRSLYPDPVNTTINLELLERICQDSSILEELSGVSQLTAGLDDIDLLEEEEEGDGEGMEKSDL